MKKVLVVDDNEDILDVISVVLDFEGYEVKCAADGNKVPDLISSFSPDLILLDIMLGGIDGREICKSLKSNIQTKHIPVVMISASHNLYNSTDHDCMADDFVAKPFDIYDLANTVKKYTS